MMADRRTFLRGLATLPLIGGSVALVGAPTAVAEPVTPDLCEAYKTWLDYERRFLCWEMAADPLHQGRYHPLPGFSPRGAYFRAMERVHYLDGEAGRYHGIAEAQPSTRAALVLSAVGCDWRA